MDALSRSRRIISCNCCSALTPAWWDRRTRPPNRPESPTRPKCPCDPPTGHPLVVWVVRETGCFVYIQLRNVVRCLGLRGHLLLRDRTLDQGLGPAPQMQVEVVDELLRHFDERNIASEAAIIPPVRLPAGLEGRCKLLPVLQELRVGASEIHTGGVSA